MDQVHDIDADGEFDGPPSTENSPSVHPAASIQSGRPDANGSCITPDPFDAPPVSPNPKTMYICAGVVAFGLLMVAAGLMFGGGGGRREASSEPRPVSTPALGYFGEQQQMAREAMTMAREAQQLQRERLNMMRQQMMEGENGTAGAESVAPEVESPGD